MQHFQKRPKICVSLVLTHRVVCTTLTFNFWTENWHTRANIFICFVQPWKITGAI